MLSTLLIGCGSSSTTSDATKQTIFFDEYTASISDKFLPVSAALLQSDAIPGSTIAAYSVPAPSNDYYEKNIIISQDSLGSLSLSSYTQESLAAIRTTRGGYNNFESNDRTISCNGSTIPALQHNFQITRGGLGQDSQIIYFVQYYFANHNKMTIVSASSDVQDDIDIFQDYLKSISCASDSTGATAS